MTEARLLSVQHLTMRFGGLIAVDDLSFVARDREITAIIGPNGAGKTTLFHMLTGTRMITSGTIVFDGHDVTREADYQRVQRGIARSFQVTSLFPSLSVRENLRLAALGTTPRRALHGWRLPQGELACADTVDRVLDRLELPRLADTPAAVLSHGQQRRLEVGMALAANPRAIFLDEPTSGMGVDDLPAMKALIRGLAQDHTVVLIEHNMDIVMDISDMITVMQQGKVLMEGTPDAVRADPRVRAAYLGNMITGGKA